MNTHKDLVSIQNPNETSVSRLKIHTKHVISDLLVQENNTNQH